MAPKTASRARWSMATGPSGMGLIGLVPDAASIIVYDITELDDQVKSNEFAARPRARAPDSRLPQLPVDVVCRRAGVLRPHEPDHPAVPSPLCHRPGRQAQRTPARARAGGLTGRRGAAL